MEAPRQVTSGPNPTRAFAIPALAVDPDDPSTVAMAVGDARNGGCCGSGGDSSLMRGLEIPQ